MRKRILAVLMSAVTTVTAVFAKPQTKASALVFSPNSMIQSEAAVLLNMDLNDNKIVYEKNADMTEYPGFLAQVMTAVIVLENCNDIGKETVEASKELFAPFADYENQIDLRYANIGAKDTLTVEDLLYAMMLTSSCEAAVMLADHFGGEEAFVQKMNDKAQLLEMKDTRFTNATGLYSARQLTTAHDMAKLLQYAITVPMFETISCAESYTPPTAESLGKTKDWNWEHSNLLIDKTSEYFCNGVRGIKTGNLQEGGRNICCKASRDGNNYLLVCLNAPLKDENGKNHYYHLEDAKTIVNWAFDHLSFKEILTKNTEIKELQVENADGVDYVILRPAEEFSCIWSDATSESSIQRIIQTEEHVKAPIEAGEKLGTIQLKYSGETLATIDLVASNSVKRSFMKYNLSIIPGFFHSGYLGAAWKIALVLSILYFGLCVYFFARYKQQRKRRKQANAMKKNI